MISRCITNKTLTDFSPLQKASVYKILSGDSDLNEPRVYSKSMYSNQSDSNSKFMVAMFPVIFCR